MSIALGACAPGPPPPGARVNDPVQGNPAACFAGWVAGAASPVGSATVASTSTSALTPTLALALALALAPTPTRAPTPTPTPAWDPEEPERRLGVRAHEQGAVVVDGVRIEVTSITVHGRLKRTIVERAGPDGVFSLPDEATLTDFVVRRPGAATFRCSPSGCGFDGVRRRTRQPGLTVLEIDLEREVQLTGRLVDTHGVPVFGATLSIDGTRVFADPQGRFRIGGLTSEEHVMVVDVSDPLLVPSTRSLVRPPGDVELVVERAGEVLVQVDLPRPRESRSVVCVLREDTPDARVVLQVDGRAGEPVRVSGLRAGRYLLEIQGPSFVPQRSLPFEVVPGVALQARFPATARWLRARPVRPDGTRLATVVRYTTAQGIEVTRHFGALVILPVPRDAVRVRVESAEGLQAVVDLAPGERDVDLGALRLGAASS